MAELGSAPSSAEAVVDRLGRFDTRNSVPGPAHARRLSGLGSMRYIEPVYTQVSTIRDLRLCDRFWNDLCRRARFGRDAQASVECRHEPKNGGDHERFSGPLGVLRFVDSFATDDRVERGCSMQFPERRRLRRAADSAAVRPSCAGKQITGRCLKPPHC
jgi:hypothetical protein